MLSLVDTYRRASKLSTVQSLSVYINACSGTESKPVSSRFNLQCALLQTAGSIWNTVQKTKYSNLPVKFAPV